MPCGNFAPIGREASMSRPGLMVDLSRLELPTSRLSGVRSNHLSYRSIWQGRQDLNPRHPVLETDVLPTELLP